ncbi:MAG: hypothetical protein H6725_06755 [Sandaracinaceae bacterium]|nr:hypothetical protein [Sandaracinaceae bacterium]
MTEPEGSRRARALEYSAVTLLPALLTLGRFANGFVFDDVFVIVRGAFIHDPANIPRAFTRHAMVASSLDAAVGQPALDTYRPVPLLSFFWDAWLSGREPWAYHLTNMALHVSVCAALLALLRRVFPRLPSVTRVGLACAFGLSPWLSEAHVWINGRSDPLMTLFVLLALHAALRSPTPRSRGLVGGACLLALLSKEVAVLALPFIVLAPWWIRREDGQGFAAGPLRARQFAGAVAAPALALGVYLGLRATALRGLKTHDDGTQLLAALRNLPFLELDGLYRALLPSAYGLRSMRDDYALATPLVVAAACLGCVALALVAFALRRAAPTVGFGLAWFGLTIAPACLISTVLWPGFGRYLYLPSVGLVLALGGGLETLAHARPRLRRAALGLPVLLALLSGPLLVFATALFHDEVRLYGDALERVPQQAWAHGFLGLHLRREGDCDGAIPLLGAAANLDPSDARYLTHLGHCMVETRRREAALAVALEGERRFAGTRQEAAFLLIHASSLPADRFDDIEPLLRRCLELFPGRPDCAQALAQVAQVRAAQP